MELKDKVHGCLQSMVLDMVEYRGDLTVTVPRSRIVEALKKLKEDAEPRFDFLTDIIGVDNSALYQKKKAKKKKSDQEEAPEEQVDEPLPPRFEVIYLVQSLETNERLRVKVKVPEEEPWLDSITSLWRGANWPEREIYDMFGIRFRGHPNLKRLLMWEGFGSHPLRKDYPLEGKGEERSFDQCMLF